MFDSFFTRHWFSEPAKAIWSERATLQAWLEVEAALAQAQAELDIVPVPAAETIKANARTELFDLDRLAADIAHTQHPFVPVLKQFEAICGEPAAGFIHWGATTQNIFDTAAALQLRRSHTLLMEQLDASVAAMARLAVRHRDALQAGRTHGQHALPMTFGFKVAGWLDEVRRHRARLVAQERRAFVAALGGAIGTFAAMGGRGRAVQARVAEILGLTPATLPMRSSFDRGAEYVATLGLLAATAEKIAHEVAFMQRTEIGEAEEASHLGKVGSSTMAQKRNPSIAGNLIGMARMARSRVPLALESMVRANEGEAAAANVADVLLPEAAILAVSIAEKLAQLMDGLVVHPEIMRRNLDLSRGRIMSEAVMMRLGERIGRHRAHHLLYEAAHRSVTDSVAFATALAEHPTLDGLDVDLLLDPSTYLGEAPACVDDVVAACGQDSAAAAPARDGPDRMRTARKGG
jgi:adenylosuccinate lyase/3-carboxy-cis,cis-muconate cycloisomerase